MLSTLNVSGKLCLQRNAISSYTYDTVGESFTVSNQPVGPNLQNFVKWTFVILSQFFRMPFVCQLISYRTKSSLIARELRKKRTIDWRVTRELRIVYEKFTKLFVTLS